MNGLPKIEDRVPPRDVWDVMVLGGIERLTERLRRGDAFNAASLNDMQALQRRLKAFSDALDMRMNQVIED